MSTKSTRKAESLDRDTLRPDYDRATLGKGVRSKYTKRFGSGSNLVLLSPDVAKAFPDSDSVNTALRGLLDVAQRAVKPTAAATRHHD